MKNNSILLLIALSLAIPQALAQPSKQYAEEIRQTREEIREQRKQTVALNLELTPQESRSFWPLYEKYRKAMQEVGDRQVRMITAYADNVGQLSDELAETLVKEFLAVERQRNNIRIEYFTRFRRILPIKKTARFFQIENKLDALMNYDLARKVPLIE